MQYWEELSTKLSFSPVSLRLKHTEMLNIKARQSKENIKNIKGSIELLKLKNYSIAISRAEKDLEIAKRELNRYKD